MQSRKEIRSFRLNTSLLARLSLSARRQKVSESSIVEKALEQSLKMEMLLPVFDTVSLGRETFKAILMASETDTLVGIGNKRGRKAFALARELYESNGLGLTFPLYLTEILAEEGRWFRAEGTLVKPERMTLSHGLGPKWSQFLKAYVASAHEVILGEKLEVSTDDEFVSINLLGQRVPRE